MNDITTTILKLITEEHPHVQVYLARLGISITAKSHWQVELDFGNKKTVSYQNESLLIALLKAYASHAENVNA